MKRIMYKLNQYGLLALCLLGVFACQKAKSEQQQEEEKEQERVADLLPVRLMSFNIRYNTTADTGEKSWASRKNACFALIRDIDPDVIGFQEPRMNASENQRQDIISALSSDYAWHAIKTNDPGVSNTVIRPSTGSAVDAETKTGYTLLVYKKERFTLVESGYFWLGATPDKACIPFDADDDQVRTCIWVHLRENEKGHELYFFDTHSPYTASTADNVARLQCFNLIVSKMKDIAGYDAPLVVVGDMNSSYALNDTRRDALEPYYKWMYAARGDGEDYGVYRYHTYPSDYYAEPRVYSYNDFGGQSLATTWNIDHIFYRNMIPVEFRTITSPDYGVTYVSDHYPIILDAKF
ncbi:MAG: endonuclease/exonuclease/phosphatase family protein [Bacteroidales bacterium]|nr:endonuclease/exonuclease/phosphatase family protein [Bacteroidales bacterium]